MGRKLFAMCRDTQNRSQVNRLTPNKELFSRDTLNNGHINKALNSMYTRFKGLTLLSAQKERLEMVESKISSNPYFDKATSVITAVDRKVSPAAARTSFESFYTARECRVSHNQFG